MEIVRISEVNTEMSDIDNTTSPKETYVRDIIIEYPVVRYILVALHILTITLAAIGNGALVYIIIKRWRKTRKNVTTYLVFNLAMTELVGIIFYQPMRLVDILLPEAFDAESELIYCKTSGFVSAFFAGVSFHTIVGISQERFLLICYPLKAKSILTIRRTRNIMLSIWLFGFSLHEEYFHCMGTFY